GPSIRRFCPWLLSQLQEPFVGQAAQERADVRQNSLARRCVALASSLTSSAKVTSPVQRLIISAAMASALNTRSGEGLPACVAARAYPPPTQAGMSGSDSSTAETLPHRRTQDAGGQSPHSGSTQVGSELGRQIPVDLQADADLNEGWGCP